jgi:aromatic ring-opening dioxygenase catalytic subunit (LigB family)
MNRLPTFFISHGGGPWPWLDGGFRRQFDPLEASLKEIAASLPEKPRAVLVISGHWEEDRFTVMSAERPGMVYDYSGFPRHTYEIRYGAPGSPQLANRVRELLEAAGIPVALDASRGYDHGTFVPLAVMYPNADVPVVQLSIKHSYRPEEHLAAGRALAPLSSEGVLIVGSGLSYHNLRAFGPAARAPSQAFDEWLGKALAAPPGERTKRLLDWESAPAARIAHPQEDHFIPLLVAVGAAEQEPAHRVYHEEGFMGGVTASSYRFGDAPARDPERKDS